MRKERVVCGWRGLLVVGLVVAIVAGGWWGWERWFAPTRVALVNFQSFQRAGIVRSNGERFVRYEELPASLLGKVGRYDFTLVFGMGLRLTEGERGALERAMARGAAVYVYSPTSPENKISSLDSVSEAGVYGYLSNGTRGNYGNLARYIRRRIDGKRWFVGEAGGAEKSATDVLYHLDEGVSFGTVGEYEAYLRAMGHYKEGGAKVAIVGGLNEPFGGNKDNTDSLITALEGRLGVNVEPIYSYTKRLELLSAIKPDAVIYYAHGRLAMGGGEEAVEWLRGRNIPLFAPLGLLRTREEWEADPMGMAGGFLSQSVVMPELDGGIYPYVLDAQERTSGGLELFKALPERLERFVGIVGRFLALKAKGNGEKRLAIYYFKGVGGGTLTAQGLETVPALYNLLKRLRAEGYRVENLPSDVGTFEKMLMTQGAALSPYAAGSFEDFLREGRPALVGKAEYESWVRRALPRANYEDVVSLYGEAPGEYMSVRDGAESFIAVARVAFGNVVLLPQPLAGLGSDVFAIVHGAKTAPPHPYIASYLWARYGFGADALLHFGTHGSLEFTPQKQVALSGYDWPDCLVGDVPHFYYYTIGNVGEGMTAKRRSYATLVSYLTPPFMETGLRGQFKSLQDAIGNYYKAAESEQAGAALAVKSIAVAMGLHRDLRLDSVEGTPYSAEEIGRIDNFAEEIVNEKMVGALYVLGEAYNAEKIRSTVLAMSVEPIAYSKAKLDRLEGRVSEAQLKSKPFFTQAYIAPAEALVKRLLGGVSATDALICSVAHIGEAELEAAPKILASKPRTMPAVPSAAPSASRGGSSTSAPKAASSSGGHPAWIPKIGKRPDAEEKKDSVVKQVAAPTSDYTAEQKARARAILEIAHAVRNVSVYKRALEESPEKEMQALLNALNGGYIAPSSGGDAVANPNAIPTGRNLYAINAESTPSEVAWEKGVGLVEATLEQYKKRHGAYPRKVSYTFWSSEFIESEGATVAQVLYMLGVEPLRDSYGRVFDLQLIPSERLGRPRIDIVVQTSGQFRDLAASRLSLISRAVEMAASASSDAFDNYVAGSVVETERQLVERGVSPKEARELSVQRVFGGINGMYGTNIQGMVTSGDKWESAQEIADAYIHNMGASYTDEKHWGDFREGLLRAVLHNTDAVVQPRQSNTWGALSLDHVYEFMGGMNLAVREVTGKDPEAYFADYRNRHNVKMQELKESIGVEARATVFNPAYVREVLRGNAASAAQITEVVTNTFGWKVMKPDVIDDEMWDKLYKVYVNDEYRLGTEAFFRRVNPQALQEITAVMLETVRKGLWNADEAQVSRLVQLHTELVKEFGSSASGFAGGNAKLQEFIAQRTDAMTATAYRQQLQKMRTAAPDGQGMVLKKSVVQEAEAVETTTLNGLLIAAAVVAAFIVLLFLLRRRRGE